MLWRRAVRCSACLFVWTAIAHRASSVVAVVSHTHTCRLAQTAYFLRRNGFECPDPVVIKMISLAAQKFLTDLA